MFKRNQLPYSHTIPFHGFKLNYQILGEGKPVVFVHGAFTNSSSYMKNIKLLAKDYKVYILDLPGFGGSDVVKGKVHNSDLFVEALSLFLKKTKLEKAPIIALSMGVIIALKAAAKRQTKGKLILLSPPGHTDKGFATQFFARLPISVRRFVFGTNWGRKTILLPIASANTGTEAHTADLLLEHLSHTSNEAMVDSDYIKDIYSYHTSIPRVANKIVYVYGENDRMKKHKFEFINNYVEVAKGGHNIFADTSTAGIKTLRSLL
jgi:pimeloyl-ACP methyl ester carboxylesterase